MILASTLDSPTIELTTKLKSGDKKVEVVNLTEFIDVKGWRSIGNKICGKEFHKAKLLKPIEPVELTEPEKSNDQEITDQKEIIPSDDKPKPKEELDKEPKKVVTNPKLPEPKLPKKDEDEDSNTFTSGDQISLL